MKNKVNQAPAAAEQSELIGNIAALFTSTTRDYYFGNITDKELFECQLDRINGFLEEVYKHPLRGKIAAITRLIACYTKYSQDDKEARTKTLEALAGISGLLETVFAYTDDIALWADFTGTLSEKITVIND